MINYLTLCQRVGHFYMIINNFDGIMQSRSQSTNIYKMQSYKFIEDSQTMMHSNCRKEGRARRKANEPSETINEIIDIN